MADSVTLEIRILMPGVRTIRTRDGKGHQVKDGVAKIARARPIHSQILRFVAQFHSELVEVNSLRENQVRVIYPMPNSLLIELHKEVRDTIRQVRLGVPGASEELKVRLIRAGHVDGTSFGLSKLDWQMPMDEPVTTK